MTSFDLALNSSMADDDLEAELKTGDEEDELTEPEETGSEPKKPVRKNPAEDDTLETADDGEPEIDNSYLKDFGDGNAE